MYSKRETWVEKSDEKKCWRIGEKLSSDVLG